MPKYEVRTNCEYILEVEANSVDEAIKEANKVDLGDWEHAWADYEAECVDEDDEGAVDA